MPGLPPKTCRLQVCEARPFFCRRLAQHVEARPRHSMWNMASDSRFVKRPPEDLVILVTNGSNSSRCPPSRHPSVLDDAKRARMCSARRQDGARRLQGGQAGTHKRSCRRHTPSVLPFIDLKRLKAFLPPEDTERAGHAVQVAHLG